MSSNAELALMGLYRSETPLIACQSWDAFLCRDCFFLRYHNSPVSFEDIAGYLSYRQTQGAALDHCAALNDMRSFPFASLDRAKLERVLDVNQRFPGRAKSRRAFLVGDDLGFGMLRMYQMLTDIRHVAPEDQILVTKDAEEALYWLGVSLGDPSQAA